MQVSSERSYSLADSFPIGSSSAEGKKKPTTTLASGYKFPLACVLALVFSNLAFMAHYPQNDEFFVVSLTPAFHEPETDRHIAGKRANDERLNPHKP